MRRIHLAILAMLLVGLVASPVHPAPRVRGGGAATLSSWTCRGLYCGPGGVYVTYGPFRLVGAIRLDGSTFTGMIVGYPSGAYYGYASDPIEPVSFSGSDGFGNRFGATCSLRPVGVHVDATAFIGTCAGAINAGRMVPFTMRIQTADLPTDTLIYEEPSEYFVYYAGVFAARS